MRAFFSISDCRSWFQRFSASVFQRWIHGFTDPRFQGLSSLRNLSALCVFAVKKWFQRSSSLARTLFRVSAFQGFSVSRRDPQARFDLDTWTPGHLDTWTPGHLDTWTLGHPHARLPDYRTTRLLAHPHTLLLACILAIFLSACSQPETGPTRIRIWHQKDTAERLHFEKVVERYNTTVTDHQVEILYKETEDLRNQYVIAAAGGKGPELIFGPADNIGLLELTETIKPLEEVFESEFFDRFIDEGLVRRSGKTWMVADQVGNHLTLVYNADLISTPPETIAELIEIGKQQTVDENGDGTPDRYGLTWNYREPFFFIPFLTGHGGWMMDEEGNPTLDSQATIDAIQLILELRDVHGIIPKESDYETSQALFKEGRAAMIINGPWAWAGYGEAGINYRLAPLPVDEKTDIRCRPLTSAKGYSVNVNVENELVPTLRKVVTYLTSSEVQLEMSADLATIPVHVDAVDDATVADNEVLQASLQQVRLSLPMPVLPQLRQVWDGMRGPYQLVMNGAVDAPEAARMMQRQVQKLIDDTFL